MVKQSSLKNFLNAKLYIMYSLAFFAILSLSRCHRPPKQPALIWKNNKAIGISISVKSYSLDSLAIINVRKIFGSFVEHDGWIEFKPAIPLTEGLTYQIWNGKQQIGQLTVPLADRKFAPILTAIYPERDTVPANLLKFYFRFSKPMRTGQSLAYIYLLDKNRDTLSNVFLNLQPELWDTTGKVLTIWIDPGRVKRDLVLNQQLGSPLVKNESYTLEVASGWKDTQGLALAKKYTKSFIVGEADYQVPVIEKWVFTLPKANTRAPLIIDAKEGLDQLLFSEGLSVLNANDKYIPGSVRIKNDQIWEFYPSVAWLPHVEYQLRVDTRLEDLAANNLLKVFDRDLHKDKSKMEVISTRKFVVR